jgi:hypothetical protein
MEKQPQADADQQPMPVPAPAAAYTPEQLAVISECWRIILGEPLLSWWTRKAQELRAAKAAEEQHNLGAQPGC